MLVLFALFQMFYSLVCLRLPINRVGAHLDARTGQDTHCMPIKLILKSGQISPLLLLPTFSGATT